MIKKILTLTIIISLVLITTPAQAQTLNALLNQFSNQLHQLLQDKDIRQQTIDILASSEFQQLIQSPQFYELIQQLEKLFQDHNLQQKVQLLIQSNQVQKLINNPKIQELLKQVQSGQITSISSCQGIKFNQGLGVGMSKKEVRCLQAILNQDQETQISTGIGSLGKESVYFGPKTMIAVKKFQKKYGIPPTGYVGPLTRQKLNSLLGY